MKASKFSDAQEAFILKQGNEGVSVVEICRKAGSARRLKKYAGRTLPRNVTGRSVNGFDPSRRPVH